MNSNRFRVLCLVLFAGLFLQCAKDYNPFENYSNANALVLPSASSKGISNGDTLNIFTTETLAVYTMVREKIDSFKVTAPNNRYFTDSVIKPPFSKDNYQLLLSFYDTGRTSINVTTYRSNNTSVSLPAPISVYVKSPLSQQPIDTVFGAPFTLRTDSVGDEEVLYIWAFGKDTVQGIASNSVPISYSDLRHVQVGVLDTGYLSVTDIRGEFRSPAAAFSYLFFRPAPPKIKCTNKGLSHDTVITSDTTLTFTFQVIDSSGQGLAEVELGGSKVQTSDSVNFYKTFTGMNAYPSQNPKVEVITAANRLGDTTIDTFYLCYEQNGPQGDLVMFRLDNPASPTLTTRIDTLFYIVNVDNYTLDTATVSTLVTGPAGKQTGLSAIYSFSDSTHKCAWFVPLVTGTNTIRTQALIPARGNYSRDTTLVVTRDPLAKDTTPPVITAITINGKLYPLNRDSLFQVDSPFVIVIISAIDNESGIASVTISQGATNSVAPITVTYIDHVWVSSPIAFSAGPGPGLATENMTLTITVKNKLLTGTAAITTTTKMITLERQTSVIPVPQPQ